MRVTTIDRFEPAAGVFRHWTVDPSDAGSAPSPIPPSFNQRMHLAAPAGGSTWLAGAFDVDGHLDTDALERAFRSLIARHGTLRSSFRRTGDDVSRRSHRAPTRLRRQPSIRCDSAATLRAVLWQTLSASCDPFVYPAFMLGAIDRPDRSTIVCGFDHSHVDAYSIAIVIEDLRRLYRGEPLESVGDFLDYCAHEAAAVVAPRDPRLAGWRTFFGTDGITPPSFPLDLGLAPGRAAPQAVELRRLLSEGETRAFDSHCRSNGASVFAGCLVAMVRALGVHRMRTVFPVHTRSRVAWRNAVGWFVGNAPIEADDDLGNTGQALRAAIELGGVPLGDVAAALGGITLRRKDVFMVSYVDYRHVPGAARHRDIAAQHISDVAEADDVQFWISRTDDGLALRVRYPDTVRAREVVGGFLHRFAEALQPMTAAERLSHPISRKR